MGHDVRSAAARFLEPSAEAEVQAQIPYAQISIGGISVSLRNESRKIFCLGRELNAFRAASEISDIEIQVRWVEGLRALNREVLFDSGAIWSLRARAPEMVFEFKSPLDVAPYKRLVVDSDFRKPVLLLNASVLASYLNVNPLEYPADELLFTNYLAGHGLGVELHGCGIIDPETGGHLFLGHSGAGKSTTSRLWQSMRNAEILSDDRIILRLHDGAGWMYGTPWHGEAAFSSPGKARVNRIFILEHGERNQCAEIPRARAVAELFARSFPPFHSAEGLANTMAFLDRALANIPCYRFEFTPDARAIEAVLRFRA